MGHSRSRLPRLLAVALGALALASCYRLFSTRISKIEGNLVKYDGTVVTVYGTVKERLDLPGLKCFVVDDGSGTIGVVTRGTLPRVGDVVHSKGTVKSGFKIGRRSLIVLLPPASAAKPTPRPTPSGAIPS